MNNFIEQVKSFSGKNRKSLGIFIFLFLVFMLIIGLAFFSKKNTKTALNYGPCSKTIADKPETLSNWKISIYSAPLEQSSPDITKSNSVKTFSLKGLTDKTESNSMYARFEFTDGSYITGYDTGIELCNNGNKTNDSYRVVKNGKDSVAGENVSARMHYLHGGRYILEPGTYRLDALVKDKQGVWHLVGRVEGIQIMQ